MSALAEGRWARLARLRGGIADGETAEACFGLATALWWLGENQASVERAPGPTRCSGETASRRGGAVRGVAGHHLQGELRQLRAANGWIGRAERLLDRRAARAAARLAVGRPGLPDGGSRPREALTERALELARAAGDVDLELGSPRPARADPGRQGRHRGGLRADRRGDGGRAGGERSSLDTVVYTCCDMLNACELPSDVERAAQWCQVADDFVATYGCPFLYAECRIYYGSVLTPPGGGATPSGSSDAACESPSGAVRACTPGHSPAWPSCASARGGWRRPTAAVALGGGVEAEAEDALSLAALLAGPGGRRGAGPAARTAPTAGKHRSAPRPPSTCWSTAHIASGHVDRRGDAARRRRRSRARRPAAVGAAAATARPRPSPGRPAAQNDLGPPWRGGRARPAVRGGAHAVRPRPGPGASDPDAAIDHARRALASFEQLGAVRRRPGRRVPALAGGRPRTGAKGVGTLTAREQEVLRLLAAGCRTRRSPTRLHVSRKTASHHVSSILASSACATAPRPRARTAVPSRQMGQLTDAADRSSPDDRA